MSSITFFIEKDYNKLYGTLLGNGYTKLDRHNFVKNTAQGRFHFVVKENPLRVELHFDVFIDGRHVVFHTPKLLKEEYKKFIYNIRLDIKEDKLEKMFEII